MLTFAGFRNLVLAKQIRFLTIRPDVTANFLSYFFISKSGEKEMIER